MRLSLNGRHVFHSKSKCSRECLVTAPLAIGTRAREWWRGEVRSPSPMNRLTRLLMGRLIERTDCETIWRPSINTSHRRRDQRIARRFLSHKLTQEVDGRVSIDQIYHASIIPCAR